MLADYKHKPDKKANTWKYLDNMEKDYPTIQQRAEKDRDNVYTEEWRGMWKHMGKHQECIRNNKTREEKLNTLNTEQVNVKIKQKYANTQTLTGTHKLVTETGKSIHRCIMTDWNTRGETWEHVRETKHIRD